MPSSADDRPGYLSLLGPGIAIAATGVGAGDMVAAAVSGSRFGIAVAWAAIVGALLKFVLNEGLARWQLATGTTLLEGWTRHLGRWVQYIFLVYLVFWSFVVAGALISACGLAAHALVPAVSLEIWGVVHSLAAAALVLIGGYAAFERLVKWFVGLMFVTLVGCAVLVDSPARTLARTVTEASVPPGGAVFIAGVIGGVGGSVTLLSYCYWIREKRWEGPSWLRVVRVDLAVAYVLTGIFGLAIIVLAAHALHAEGTTIRGSGGVIQMAGMLEGALGSVGRWTFLVGFWGAVSTSLLGVWQGVPYLFADFVGLMQGLSQERRRAATHAGSVWYRGYLLWLALPPLVLLFLERPVMIVVVYSVMGALFMPFLAATLLYMNSREDLVGPRLRTGWIGNLLLLFCLALFTYLAAHEIIDGLR